MLEFDHIRPVALGGTSTVDDLAVACRAHNFYAAELIFGREFMEQFRKKPAANAPTGRVDSGESNGDGAASNTEAAGVGIAGPGAKRTEVPRREREISTDAVQELTPGKEDYK
jgi:hypothetical protein